MWEIDESERSKKLSDELELAWNKSVKKFKNFILIYNSTDYDEFFIRFYASKSKKIKKILNIEYKKAENLEETIKTVLLYLEK